MLKFIENAYDADVIMVAKVFKDEPSVTASAGVMNFMAHQEMQLNQNEFLFDTGIIYNGDLSKVFGINEDLITEEATHAWYENNEPLHPYDGKQTQNIQVLKIWILLE